MHPLPVLLLPLLLASQIGPASATATLPATPASPLSTKSRWVVDAKGRRVKLACVSWAAHMEAGMAEGLGSQPLGDISRRVDEMGFNCVRLTWPTHLVTDAGFGSLTVRRSLEGLGLVDSAAGVQAHNPHLSDLTLLQAFQAVVENLGSNNIMVILDNHITKPGWCCSIIDGNGFFGDKYFDPDVWIKGLTRMAMIFNASANVVGMSLRNELRGFKQNIKDWYKYMQRGAETVHAMNPNVLVILSGLSFDNDLSFLSKKQVELSFSGKLVFELHWYAFFDGKIWESRNTNQVCGSLSGNVMRKGGFLVEQGWPLFLSEFGIDQRGTSINDNRFISCILGVAAELDLDFSVWALQGSYYLREGKLAMDETFGILSWDWSGPRNSSFLQRISTLQSPLQGPNLSSLPPYKIIFHPLTGLCITRKSLLEPLSLGPCEQTEAWIYTEKQALMLKNTIICLKAQGEEEPAMFGITCGEASAQWEVIADSGMHLLSKLENNGSSLCLDVGSDGRTLVTSRCRCLSKDNGFFPALLWARLFGKNTHNGYDPASQWFKMVTSTRDIVNKNMVMSMASDAIGIYKI